MQRSFNTGVLIWRSMEKKEGEQEIEAYTMTFVRKVSSWQLKLALTTGLCIWKDAGAQGRAESWRCV